MTSSLKCECGHIGSPMDLRRVIEDWLWHRESFTHEHADTPANRYAWASGARLDIDRLMRLIECEVTA